MAKKPMKDKMAKKPMKEEMTKKPMKEEGKANGLTPAQKKLPPALQAAMLKRMKKK